MYSTDHRKSKHVRFHRMHKHVTKQLHYSIATFMSNAVSRVPAGSEYRMAHCLWKGLGLGVVLAV